MRRRFHKMSGLGNVFVIVDARETPLKMDRARARHIADRKTGIGCDQLILIEPPQAADMKMRIFNADGGEVEASGNASTCFAPPAWGGARFASPGAVIGAAAPELVATVDLGVPPYAGHGHPRPLPLQHSPA